MWNSCEKWFPFAGGDKSGRRDNSQSCHQTGWGARGGKLSGVVCSLGPGCTGVNRERCPCRRVENRGSLCSWTRGWLVGLGRTSSVPPLPSSVAITKTENFLNIRHRRVWKDGSSSSSSHQNKTAQSYWSQCKELEGHIFATYQRTQIRHVLKRRQRSVKINLQKEKHCYWNVVIPSICE